jgi:hypothetical protein
MYACHVVSVTIDGVWIVNGFTDHIHTTRKYKQLIVPPLISTIYKSLQHHLSLFPRCCVHQPFPGNGL